MSLRDFLRWWLRGLRATAVAVDEALTQRRLHARLDAEYEREGAELRAFRAGPMAYRYRSIETLLSLPTVTPDRTGCRAWAMEKATGERIDGGAIPGGDGVLHLLDALFRALLVPWRPIPDRRIARIERAQPGHERPAIGGYVRKRLRRFVRKRGMEFDHADELRRIGYRFEGAESVPALRGRVLLSPRRIGRGCARALAEQHARKAERFLARWRDGVCYGAEDPEHGLYVFVGHRFTSQTAGTRRRAPRTHAGRMEIE